MANRILAALGSDVHKIKEFFHGRLTALEERVASLEKAAGIKLEQAAEKTEADAKKNESAAA